MTEMDLELQDLARENAKLRKEVEDLRQIHQLDQAQLIFLRRMIESFVEEGNDG